MPTSDAATLNRLPGGPTDLVSTGLNRWVGDGEAPCDAVGVAVSAGVGEGRAAGLGLGGALVGLCGGGTGWDGGDRGGRGGVGGNGQRVTGKLLGVGAE